MASVHAFHVGEVGGGGLGRGGGRGGEEGEGAVAQQQSITAYVVEIPSVLCSKTLLSAILAWRCCRVADSEPAFSPSRD